MWQAKIIESGKHLGNARTIIDFFKGTHEAPTEIFRRELTGTGSIEKFIKEEIKRQENFDTFVASVPLGIVDLDSIPDELPNPEDDKFAYLRKRDELIILKKDLELGIITPEEYTNKLSEVQDIKPIK